MPGLQILNDPVSCSAHQRNHPSASSCPCRTCAPLPIHCLSGPPRNLMNNSIFFLHFEAMAENADHVQKALLRSILQENSRCEYLQHCQLPPATRYTDLATFRRHVPLVTHSDIKPYIDRIVNGDKSSILTSAPLEAMSLSSGTTNAQQKYIPFYDKLKTMTLELASIAAANRDQVYPLTPGSRSLDFLFAGRYKTTKGGLKAATGTTHLIRGGVFKERSVRCMGVQPCSPDEVVLASNCHQAMYCHLLCGLLLHEDVQVLTAVFSYTMVEAFRMLEVEWQQLCKDIKLGTLNTKITEPNLLSAMRKVLTKPNPELANSISERIETLVDWHGVIPKLWPKCKYILSIVTGAMEPYLERLQHYAGNALPIACADYAASEGWIAINIRPTTPPRQVTFTIVPNLAFFEFIPLYQQKCSSKPAKQAHIAANTIGTVTYMEGDPICLTEVNVGQEYEIVLTTHGGLYRYRLGDVVKVTGFFKSCPQFRYVCRKNVVLSINIDKNTEKDLSVVVSKGASRLAEASGRSLHLVDYTSYADQAGPNGLGHYVICWEISKTIVTSYDTNPQGRRLRHELISSAPAEDYEVEMADDDDKQSMWLQQCATLMDSAFVEPGYVTSRKMGTIGPLQLCVVKPGTFSKMLDTYLAKGPSITQYKTPRCIVSNDHLKILRPSTSYSCFSSANQF